MRSLAPLLGATVLCAPLPARAQRGASPPPTDAGAPASPETPETPDTPETESPPAAEVPSPDQTGDSGSDPTSTPEPSEPQPTTSAPTPAITEAPAAPRINAAADLDDDLDDDLDPSEGEVGSGEGYDPLRDSPEAISARHWFRTGIGLVAAGGALGVGAIIIGAADPCAPRAGNSCLAEARTRGALTMGVPALVFVGAGTAALLIARKRRTRLAASVAVVQGITIQLRGRF